MTKPRRTTKHDLRFRLLVEVQDASENAPETPLRRGLELVIPAGSKDARVAQQLQDLVAASFGMLENDMNQFNRIEVIDA